MLPTDRIAAFVKLGEVIRDIPMEERESLARRAENQNNWFTTDSVNSALEGIACMLSPEKLEKWLSAYDLGQVTQPRSVGLMLAGNIPAVGFHDLMCVLLAGHKACLKLSSSDEVLMKWITAKLIEIDGRFEPLITLEEMLKSKDAYIATGSDNSSRYFNYYFGKYPHVIRQNRTSVAVLSGSETEADFLNLGKDIFRFYGLGCRNVSKLYVKSEDDLKHLLDALEVYAGVASHHKYQNNYDYNKSIYLVNGENHLDNGFLLLRESEELVSPISVLNYEIYRDLHELNSVLRSNQDKIQCVVADPAYLKGTVPFGVAQHPEPWDYADGVDTLAFLLKL